jgi:VWFA-related protein
MAARGVVWQSIKQAMPEMPASDALYLYLLVKDGSLYPVHGLPPIAGGEQSSEASWIQNIGPLLNTAMNKVNQLRPTDLETQVNLRFQATYNALEKVRGNMAVIPGRKELIWATYGIPSSIRFAGNNWFDCTPLLRQLAARYNQSDIAIYTLDPGVNLNRGQLNRDTLDILTGITGGRSFGTSDIREAAVRAVADARASYSLTYVPPTDEHAGKFRKVRVTSERRGMHIQAEEGYFTAPAH